MKCFNLSLTSVLLRFYLMMAIVLVAGFTGVWWLAGFAGPVFVSVMIGLQLWPTKNNRMKTSAPNQVQLKPSTREIPVAA